MSELKLCPFCGGHDIRVADVCSVTFACGCMDCGASAGITESKAEAIKAWNTRAECENCAALNKAAGLWAKADSEKRNRDESIRNLVKLLDKRQARIKVLESLVSDMYGEIADAMRGGGVMRNENHRGTRIHR